MARWITIRITAITWGVVAGNGGERLLWLTGTVDLAALAQRLQALPSSTASGYLIGDSPAQLEPVCHLRVALGG